MATCASTAEYASDEQPLTGSPDTSFGGYNCSFVDADPGQELFCLICARLLRQPQLTDCCGNHYCSSCLKRWLENSPACPLCRESDFRTLRDKKMERQINALKVKCRNRKSGCDWTGELGELEMHIKCSCLYVLSECTNGCGFVLRRKELPNHLEHLCHLRPVTCQHCGQEGTYQFVVNEHYDQCPKVPVSCPNGCGGDPVPREGLDDHKMTCPLEPVQCKFQVVGCETVVARQHLRSHLEASQAKHLELALAVVFSTQQKMESYCSEVMLLKEELERSKDAQESLGQLVMKCRSLNPISPQVVELRNIHLSPMLQHLETEATDCLSDPFLPVIIKMGDFSRWAAEEEPWHSPPFYTSTFGYKLSLCVYANGICSGQGSHLSVYVHLMSGEFDGRLAWPVREAITVELQNQLSDSRHCRLDCSFTESSPHIVTRRVSGPTSIARRGSGSPVFIPLSKLGLQQHCGTGQRHNHRQYLKNNCLYFAVY